MFLEKIKLRISLNMPFPALFFLLCAFVSADAVKLSYIFLPGEVIRLAVNSSQQIKQSMMGKEQFTKNESRIDYIFRVQKNSKEEYLLDMQLDSIWLHMNISEDKVEGSSFQSQDKSGMFSNSLRAISKKHLKVVITPLGEIRSVADADTMFHAIIDSYTKVPEQVRTVLKEALDQRFGTDAIQLDLQNILAVYSSKSMRQNGHWQTTVPLSAELPGMIQNNWTLKNLSDKEIALSIEGKIAPPEKNDFRKLNGIMMKYELAGIRQAEYSINRMNCWIYSSNIKEDINGIVRMQGSSALPEGISWPISIQWTIECKGSILK
jgi:Family of unknown function (DUF6263)